ncbi:MAG: Mur ligase domain-containing protein [Candidatus Saccharibacteria bacterium]
MHIYFSGIGGTGIGPLALIAKEAGYEVSGSDIKDSGYVRYLQAHGIDRISIGQDTQSIDKLHSLKPIDWFVYTSALTIENPDAPEVVFCKSHNIKITKRDEFINQIMVDKHLKMIAVAGTHGKTTTTAMLVWLFKQIGKPISYSVGAKLGFGEMGEYRADSKFFIYEADEYDRNFLAFHPFLSIITGIDWDHPDIYPTRQEYESAFKQFIEQTKWNIFWQPDFDKIKLVAAEKFLVLEKTDPSIESIILPGEVNRQNAWQVIQAVHAITAEPIDELIDYMDVFPGISRRFEQIAANVYTDYAHTPEKIRGALQLVSEIAGNNFVVVYEGLHNLRQNFIKEDLRHLFDGAKKVYVVPTYLAREDPKQAILTPQDIVNLLSVPGQGTPSQLDEKLKNAIKAQADSGVTVLCLTAGGSGSLDEWLRQQFLIN